MRRLPKDPPSKRWGAAASTEFLDDDVASRRPPPRARRRNRRAARGWFAPISLSAAGGLIAGLVIGRLTGR